MARSNYRTYYTTIKALIVFFIAVATVLFRFLKEVNRLRLWGGLGKSLLISFVCLGIIAGIAQSSPEIAGIMLIGGIIWFCCYWYKKLSYADTRLNQSMWQERAWWWTLDGWQFEQEVARVFRSIGYNANVTKGSGDGGVDIIITNGSYKAIVQCKHYQNPVPPEPCRALWGCRDDFNADEVIMVASSGLTTASTRFVQNKPEFKVYNLDDIIKMTKQVQTESNQKTEEKTNILIEQSNKIKTPARSGRRLDI